MSGYNPFSLQDKNILVTGASSGIGKAIAVECSRMGANLFITARREDMLAVTLAEMEGDGNHMIPADLTDEESVGKMVKELPRLDGVVHCAGIGDRTLCRMIREKDIERVMSVNFSAPVLLQRSLLKSKLMNNGSSIVFIASRAPFAPTVGNGLYGASKGALIAFARVLALELAPKEIRVNSINPAMVWTDLIQRDSEIMNVDYHEKEKKYPLGRYGKPSDIAYLVLYMLSDCSQWMTGSSVDITGGVIDL